MSNDKYNNTDDNNVPADNVNADNVNADNVNADNVSAVSEHGSENPEVSVPLVVASAAPVVRSKKRAVVALLAVAAMTVGGYVAGSSYGSYTASNRVFVPTAEFIPPSNGGQLNLLVDERIAPWLPIPDDAELGVFGELVSIPEQDTMEAQSFFSPLPMEQLLERYMAFLRSEGWAVSNVAKTEFGHDAAWIPAVTFGALRTGEELNFTLTAGLSAGERLPDGYNSALIVWHVTRTTTPEEIEAFNGFGD